MPVRAQAMRNIAHFLTITVVLLGLGAGLRDATDRWVDRTELPMTLAETSIEVRGRNGDLLRAFSVEDGRIRLAPHPDIIDPGYVEMLVRYEDKRFWRHNGVDALALLRAAGQALWYRRAVSGGSTLTMQVARLLEDSGTGRWQGKFRQIRVALALERRLDKPEILNLYLTHAPYGGNLEGLRAATLAWFGKEPARLTPAQQALLVALPQRPESRRPDRHPETARAARNRVLSRMMRKNVLSGDDTQTAQNAALPRRMRPFPKLAAHAADRARARAPERNKHNLTIDATAQGALETLAQQAAHQIGQRVSVAILAVDFQSGDILASVGSPAYDAQGGRQGFVDMTQAVRSPGSTLKPLIYGLAFDQGLAHPDTIIHDGPVSFGGYAPQNFDGQFRGDVRLREALQLSLNTPVVQLANALGPARIIAALRDAGADPKLPGGKPGLAIALGGIGLTLRDLVQVYATIASAGQAPMLRVETSALRTPPARVLSDVAAWQVGHILAGLTPPPGAPNGRLAYKTGTSYGHRDAWAIGFDGAHVIGVWIGRADGTPVPGAFGGDLAAPVLFQAFGRVKPEFTPLAPPPPATLILESASLPMPLQRFRSRDAVFARPASAPQVIFPPQGAYLALEGAPLTMKLRGGTTPFSVLANGQPLAQGIYRREIEIDSPGAGYSTLVIVDSQGQSDRVTVRLE